MVSIIDEIKKLRNKESIIIDYDNTNRYRVVVKEDDGSKTAYYFSAPIYNFKTRKAVDFKFDKKEGAIYYNGSNANITFSKIIRMENAEGYCTVALDNDICFISNQELSCGNDRLFATTNGFMYKALYTKEKAFTLDLEMGIPFIEIRENNKSFSFLTEKFKPFVTISCIGTTNKEGEVISPAKISYQKLTERKYRFTLTPCSPVGEWVLFEINLYERKLMQDTTVESANPYTNNAFGTTAFIGNTAEYGEQWLYSRMELQKLSDLSDKRIIKAVLHLPKYNHTDVELAAFKVASRFCSFGSNWDNKVNFTNSVSDSVMNNNYQDIDIKPLITDELGRLTYSEGFILKSKVKNSGFSSIATGDSCYSPQICEINYR